MVWDLLGRCAEWVVAKITSRAAQRARLHQIRADVRACADAARVLRDKRPVAPASRLPVDAWIAGGRSLHVAGANNDEYDALRAFFERVRHINLSLEEAAAGYRDIQNSRAAGPLLFRPWEKARKLIESDDGVVTLYDAASPAV